MTHHPKCDRLRKEGKLKLYLSPVVVLCGFFLFAVFCFSALKHARNCELHARDLLSSCNLAKYEISANSLGSKSAVRVNRGCTCMEGILQHYIAYHACRLV